MLLLNKKLPLLFFALLLCACGFHPQGEKTLAPPLHKLYLQTADPYGFLTYHLQQGLKLSGVHLVASAQEANTILNILKDENYQSLLSVSGTQQTRQYNLSVTVVFEVTDRNGKTLLPPQALTETRTITIQSNQVLGSSNEASLYYQQMRRTLAIALLNRLASKEVTRTINTEYATSNVRNIQ